MEGRKVISLLSSRRTPGPITTDVSSRRNCGPSFRQHGHLWLWVRLALRLAGTTWLRRALHLQHAAADLVFLDRFEQRLEIAFAETVVALALDELEEDRPDGVGGENLQQHLGMAAIDHA